MRLKLATPAGVAFARPVTARACSTNRRNAMAQAESDTTSNHTSTDPIDDSGSSLSNGHPAGPVSISITDSNRTVSYKQAASFDFSAEEDTEATCRCHREDSPAPQVSSSNALRLGSTAISVPMVGIRHLVTDSNVQTVEDNAADASASVPDTNQEEFLYSRLQQFASIKLNSLAEDNEGDTSTPEQPHIFTAERTLSPPDPQVTVSLTEASSLPSNLPLTTVDNPASYPAFGVDAAEASRYNPPPSRPNFQPSSLARPPGCTSPPPTPDTPSSHTSISVNPQAPAIPHGYKRVPGPPSVYDATEPQMRAQYPRPYLPQPLPSPQDGHRSSPAPFPHADPWALIEQQAGLGFNQSLLQVDGGAYGSYSGGYPAGTGAYPGGYNTNSSRPPPYNAPPPPPTYNAPQQSYQSSSAGSNFSAPQGGYYPNPQGSPPGYPAPGRGGGYQQPPADQGYLYAAPARGGNTSDEYTYKARAPAGNMAPDSSSMYGYNGGGGGSGGYGYGGNRADGGNYAGPSQMYGPPAGNSYGGGMSNDANSYPGIELLSPGYPEYEAHMRQSGGGGGGGNRPLSYPGIDSGYGGGQRAPVPQQGGGRIAGNVPEYSDSYSAPAYGSSYSNYTSPSSNYSNYTSPSSNYSNYMSPGSNYSNYTSPSSNASPVPSQQYSAPRERYGQQQVAPQDQGYYQGYQGGGYSASGYSTQPMGLAGAASGKVVPISNQSFHIDSKLETTMPLATLPSPASVDSLAAMPASMHLGLLAAAICCVVAAVNGERTAED